MMLSSPVSPSWNLVLGTLCSVSSRSIPLLWHWDGAVPVDTLRAAGCCSHGSNAVHQLSTVGHLTAPKGVLNPRFDLIFPKSPLTVDKTDCPCNIAQLQLCRFEMQMHVLEPKEERCHFTMFCTNPSIPGESANAGRDVLVMAISFAGTSATRSEANSEWQSLPNEHISHLWIENTHTPASLGLGFLFKCSWHLLPFSTRFSWQCNVFLSFFSIFLSGGSKLWAGT